MDIMEYVAFHRAKGSDIAPRSDWSSEGHMNSTSPFRSAPYMVYLVCKL